MFNLINKKKIKKSFKTHLNLAIDRDGPVERAVHAQNGRLGRVDDGRAKQGAEDAAIWNGEGAALHVLDAQLAGAGQAGQAGQFTFDL